jgi:deoxycytidylate deaminase
MPHCPVCRRKEAGAGKGFERCPAIHAELNAVISCAASGARVSAAALYSTLTPCAGCAKMILNLDVRRVCCLEVYPDPYARELLEAAGRIFFPTDGGLAFEWHKSE